MDKLSELLMTKSSATSAIFKNIGRTDLEEVAIMVGRFSTPEIELFEHTLTSHCTAYSVGWGEKDSFIPIDLDSLWFIALVSPAAEKFMTSRPDIRVMQAINMASGEYATQTERGPTVEHMVGMVLRRLFDKQTRHEPEHLEWLGQHVDQILEHRDIISERGTLAPDFIRDLLASPRSLSDGVI